MPPPAFADKFDQSRIYEARGRTLRPGADGRRLPVCLREGHTWVLPPV